MRSNLPESARATPDPKASTPKKRPEAVVTPQRFKLPPPKLSDFEEPKEPQFTQSHTRTAPDGTIIQFNETSDQ